MSPSVLTHLSLSPCQPNSEGPTIYTKKVRALVIQTRRRQGAMLTREDDIMLTRRGFAGFASCAICGIAAFVATEASAQGTPPAATGGVTRKILSQTDGPSPGYVTMLVEATIEAGVPVGRHTHPGIESAYVVEGGFELPIQGQADPHAQSGRCLPDTARHASCRWQGRRLPRPEFSSPMSWRRGSPSHRQPEHQRDGRLILAVAHRRHNTAQQGNVARIPATTTPRFRPGVAKGSFGGAARARRGVAPRE